MKRDDGDSFVFYPTFLEQIEAIRNDRVQLALFKAVVKYGLYGDIPDFSDIDSIGGVLDAVFVPMKYVIDEAKARRKRNIANGLKGGAPKGNKNAAKPQPKTTQNNPKQPTSNLNVNVNGNGNVNNSTNVERGKGAKHFSKPTLADVEAFISENGLQMDGAAFYDYYESNGWKVGRGAMKDWKAAVRNWARREQSFAPRQGNTIDAASNAMRQIKSQMQADAAKQRQAGYASVMKHFLDEADRNYRMDDAMEIARQLEAENQME